MTILAHLSDLHVIEENFARRPPALRRRLQTLCLRRTLDFDDRCSRVLSALETAGAAADHVLVTGDLTEDGVDAQFDVLARLLRESRIDPRRITLVPGNHDAYDDESAFTRALAGPLSRFAATSAKGALVHTGKAVIVPLHTAFHQSYLRSAGRLDPQELTRALSAVSSARFRSATVVLAQHHPPAMRRVPIVHYLDGLQSDDALAQALRADDRLHVAFGHTHRSYDRPVGADRRARLFSAPAVVDDDAPVRFYRADGPVLSPSLSPREPRVAVSLPMSVAF